MRASSTSPRTRWSNDSSCQKAFPVRPRSPRLGVYRNALRSRHTTRHGPPHLLHGHPAAKLFRKQLCPLHGPRRERPVRRIEAWGRRFRLPTATATKSADGPIQTPSNKQEGCLIHVGMPVGKFSAVEHIGLAGESACPTFSARTGGKSQKNVETPGAGRSAGTERRSACATW